MNFIDKKITFKGKDALAGKEEEVTISIAQFENLPEVLQNVGGEDGIVALANAFYVARAPSSYRSSVANFMKDKTDWNEVVTFINERAGSVKDYSFTADRGPTRKVQHEILDSLDKSKIDELSFDELKALMAKMVA